MAALKKFGAAFEALRECACAVERGDLSRADLSMKRALDLAEDDNERLVRYFAQALARRAYRLLPPKYPPDFNCCSLDDERFYSFTAAKLIHQDTIGKAVLSGKSTLHLIFFSLNCFIPETNQYVQELKWSTKVTFRNLYLNQMRLKVTFIDTSNSRYITTEVDSEFDSLRDIFDGIDDYEFNRVVIINKRLDELDVSRLKIDRDDEFVVVNCFFLLGYMLPVALNKFLLMLRDDISPDMFILAEYDANLNQSEFLPRFDESLQYYSNISSFIDECCCYDSAHYLRDEISNVVACEGGARVVRHMTSDQWRHFLNKSGFSSIPVPYDEIIIDVDDFGFDFKIENGFIKINGEGQERPLFFFSAWEIIESSFDEDFYHNSLDGDDNFQNLPLSPDPQYRSLNRMASLAEIHDMTYQKLQDYKDDYHVQEILVWGKCEDNHNDGSSQLNPCLCIVDQITFSFDAKIPKYHLQERNYVTKTFESNQPCFVPGRTYEEKGLSIYGVDCLVDGAFAIKLNSRHANCEGYVVVFLFDFPNGMVGEERIREMEKILWDLRNEKSSFVTCSNPDYFSETPDAECIIDNPSETPDAECIIDNPSVQSQSHNNVMDMNVPCLQLLHGSSTPNAMPTSHQKGLLDSSIAELLNLNEVSSTPSAKPARDQSLLALPTTDIDTKEVSIKGKRKIETEAPSTSKPDKSPIWRHAQTVSIKRKIEPPAPSTSKKNKSLIWDHVKKEKGEDGKIWVICNHCGFKRKHNSKQGTTVWINHLKRLHGVKFKNVQESPQMTGVENETKIDKFKDASCGPSVPTDADQTTELVDQRSSPWSSRNETQEIPISSAKCKKVSPAHDISEDIPEEMETMLVKGTNWFFDEQSDCDNLNGWKLENHKFESCSSEKVVFTADDIAAGSKHWENALVGYVLGLKPTLAEMTCFAKTEWERFEVPKVLLLDDGVFLFAFESPDKKRIVWESHWAYSDHLLVLREWTSDLDVHNIEVSRRVPIWVEFPKLPLVLWNPKSLGRLAVHLGRPLATDKSTKNPENQLKCARVLVEVEVDTMDKLPLSIPVDLPSKSFNQTVVFDRKSVHNSFTASKKAGETTVLICGFTSEEKNLLERWRKHKLIGEIVTTIATIDVTDTSLARLVPPQENVATPYHDLHIDDTVIDAYFQLLKTKCDMHPNKYWKHHFFNCFIAKKILDGNTKDLSKWYKADDLADVCKLFLPVHVHLSPELNHWVLLCVNIEDRQLLWMDSIEGLQKFYEKERDTISKWFVGTLLPDMGYNEANWDVIVRDDIPKQENAFDCGVFVMKYADCLTQGDCFSFSQSDMVRFRERIFLDIYFRNVNANINI